MNSNSVHVPGDQAAPLGPAPDAEAAEHARPRDMRALWQSIVQYWVTLAIDIAMVATLVIATWVFDSEVTVSVPTGVIPTYVEHLREWAGSLSFFVLMTRAVITLVSVFTPPPPRALQFVYTNVTGRRTATQIWIRVLALLPVFAMINTVVKLNVWALVPAVLLVFVWQLASAFRAAPPGGPTQHVLPLTRFR